jgi:MazG family protein
VAGALDDLRALVERLRRECPWDREQTPETARTYLLEEAHEAVAALDSGDPGAILDELGDLLFQIFFLSAMASERGWFDADQVASRITAKMIERHPHVFGGTDAESAQQVRESWEKRKARSGDPLGSLPGTLPALATAHRMTARAADLGFDWEKDADVAAKVEEELSEWRQANQAGDRPAEEREIGDLLLAVANLARRRGVDPEAALRRTNTRFRERFAGVARRAAAAGRGITEFTPAELDAFWEEEKLSAVSSENPGGNPAGQKAKEEPTTDN